MAKKRTQDKNESESMKVKVKVKLAYFNGERYYKVLYITLILKFINFLPF